ncbi:hypothetical protein BC332_31282 [Capsicum chinense]|nr:hypothetical protein BC332_31282 [Capsicum chinense]
MTSCRNFIWTGQVHNNKPPLIAWHLVCRSKKEGGRWVIDCITWNDASAAKYVWNVASKSDNMRVKWVNHIYLKGYKAPVNTCCYWKNICGLKEKFAVGYVQNGWLRADGKYTIRSGYIWRRGEISMVNQGLQGWWSRIARFGMGALDDMNHLKNKRIRSVADLLQDQFGLALVRLENVVRGTICGAIWHKLIPKPQIW